MGPQEQVPRQALSPTLSSEWGSTCQNKSGAQAGNAHAAFSENLRSVKKRETSFYSSRAAVCPAPTAHMRPTEKGKGEMGQEAPGGFRE